MSKPPPAKYRTTNRKNYNAALKSRGSLMIWLDKDLQWQGTASGKLDRPQAFSDAAIQFCLTIECLFGLALRQTMGFVESLLELAGLDWGGTRLQHGVPSPEGSTRYDQRPTEYGRFAPAGR